VHWIRALTSWARRNVESSVGQETVSRDEQTGTKRLVQLHFKPLWLYVDAVREFCGFFARATFEDSSIGDRVGLVVHELVENGIRYGDDFELDLRIERGEDAFVVSVLNTAHDEQVEVLMAAFRAAQEGTPLEAYTRALHASVALPAGRGGLGLSRVRFEGNAEMALEREPGRIRVTARGKIQ
jgi:hypothetical protein